MAAHARHVLSATHSNRATVKFQRDDLLWAGGSITSPHDGEVVSLPIEADDYLVGPTILDMMTREVVRWRDLSEVLRPAGIDPQEHIAVWRYRDPDTLWPRPGQSRFRQQKPREPRIENNRKCRAPAHPFFAELASGGLPVGGGPTGFVRVRKSTTISVAEGAFRLAVAMLGGTKEAARWISTVAQAAWEADLERALELWERIGASGGELIEDYAVEALRPSSSVSQEVEREVMRQAIRWMGVDPDAEIVRPRGRQKTAAGDEGDIVRLTIAADGTVVGTFKAA